MVPPQLMERVVAEVTSHVRASKGYEEESFINPLTPVDSVAAFAMAKVLTEQNAFDVCVSIAPEGHVYGYFFQQFGDPFSRFTLIIHHDVVRFWTTLR